MYELKTNTATRIAVGPLVDPTDGKTAETALTVTALVVQIYQLANDGSAVVRASFSPTASGGTNDMALVVSSTDGMYDLELTAAQLNFYGNARITFYDVDGFLVHYTDLQIVSANYFNNKYGTTIENVNVDTIKTQAITCGAGVTINPSVGAATIVPTVTQMDARTLVSAGYASPTNITAGVITTVTNLTNAATAGDFNATQKTSLNSATPAVTVSDKTGFSLSTAGVKAIWDQATSALTTVGSMGKKLTDWVVGTIDTYTGNTKQTADVATLITTVGAAGAGLTGITGAQLAADQAVNATKFGGVAVTATTSVTFPSTCTVATTTGAVGSVTGAVGSVTGSVGSVVGDTKQTADHTAAIAAIPTTAMRGTDSAALASVLGAAVGASISADIAAIPTTAMRGTDGANTTKTGYSLAATGLDSVVMEDLAAVPGATASVKAAINWLYNLCRNKQITNKTNQEIEVYNDAGAKISESPISDDGTLFTRDKFGAVD